MRTMSEVNAFKLLLMGIYIFNRNTAKKKGKKLKGKICVLPPLLDFLCNNIFLRGLISVLCTEQSLRKVII